MNGIDGRMGYQSVSSRLAEPRVRVCVPAGGERVLLPLAAAAAAAAGGLANIWPGPWDDRR
jgi:hypothetical protein